MDYKFAGENLLKASGQEYTIIRPGHLTNGKLGSSGGLLFGQTNSILPGHSPTARSDLARVCVAALNHPNCKNCTFEISGNKNAKPPDEITFDGVSPDTKTA